MGSGGCRVPERGSWEPEAGPAPACPCCPCVCGCVGVCVAVPVPVRTSCEPVALHHIPVPGRAGWCLQGRLEESGIQPASGHLAGHLLATLPCLCRPWMRRSLSFPPCRDEGNVWACVCVSVHKGYYLMSILALSTHSGAGALIYPPSHALASREGQGDWGSCRGPLEGGSELESSRGSRADPAGTSFPRHRAPGSDCRPIWGRLGMENGKELTRAVVSSKTQKTFWVLQRGSCPSLQLAMGQGCARAGTAVPRDAPCAGCFPAPSGPTWRCASTEWPRWTSLVIHPTLPPSRPHHAAVSLPADRVAGGQHGSKRQIGSRSGMQPGLSPSSMDFGELFSCHHVHGSWIVGPRVAHL